MARPKGLNGRYATSPAASVDRQLPASDDSDRFGDLQPFGLLRFELRERCQVYFLGRLMTRRK
jgi:hypothetical protein